MKKLALIAFGFLAFPALMFLVVAELRAQTPTTLSFSTVVPQTGDSETATQQKHLTAILRAHAAAVSTSDTVDLPHAAVELWVGGTGNIKVDMLGGETGVTFNAVPVGRFPYAVKRVYATGTTATNLVALY